VSTEAQAQAAAAFEEAFAPHQQGRLDEAGAGYGRALQLDPRHVDALHMAGLLALQSADLERSLELIGRAIGIEPRNVVAHINLGNALLQAGRCGDAVASYDTAIALRSDYDAIAYCYRGNALRRLGQPEAAIESYDQAIALKADYADAHYSRGNALGDLRRYDAAAASFERAIALNPGHADAHYTRGNALRELGEHQAAIAAYGSAIAIRPRDPQAYINRGIAFGDVGQYEAAIADYDRAIARDADYAPLLGIRLHDKMRICDWSQLEAECAALGARLGRGEAVANPFAVLGISASAALQRQAAELWARERFPASPVPGAPSRPARHDRIRLGYFSGDFRDHPVAMLAAELFEVHDRSRFELTAFSFGHDSKDPVRRRLEAAFDHFVDVRQRSDEEIARLARSVEIDIAVDLGGFTHGSRPGIFARRAAPLQVSYLGYAGTMGAPYIDYLVADRTVIPAQSRQHYAEQIIYLPGSFLPHDSTRQIADTAFTRAELGLPAAGFVFCCFNNSFKITPAIFDCWMRILRGVEGSVLWLSQSNERAAANLRSEAARRGVAAERLVFAARVGSLADHLARHRVADLFIDTLPYNAHTTACDALWAGLPVLTCVGDAYASRVAASLLNAIQMTELVTATQAEYEALAIELATNPARLANLRSKVASNRLTTPLFDTRRYVRHIEAAYAAIFERCHAGRAPEHVWVGGDERSARL
jgi:predicted O-linked N-acetylglucosamine transferase (SPINDLY family)